MGNIVVSQNVTIDGVSQDPTGDEGFPFGGWFTHTEDKDREAWTQVEQGEAMGAEALLMGRRSYEWFASRWASRPGEWADRLRSLPKYVVSSTLGDAQWINTTFLTGDVLDEVRKLKEAVDGEIVVYASGQLVRALMEHDLVDEIRLMIFPVALGRKSLRLMGNRTIGEGLVQLTYQVSATRRTLNGK